METEEIASPIEYEEQYVAFIDILGFSRLTCEKNRESREKIQRCIELIDAIIWPFIERGRIKVISVSDSLILSTSQGLDDTTPRNDTSSLGSLCQVIEGIQNILICFDKNEEKCGLLVRGAISFGEAQIDPGKFRIFGPAYVQAVEIEKTYALWPRVVIDPRILNDTTRGELMRSTILSIEGNRQLLTSSDEQGLREHFLRPDHLLFIDYLSKPVRNKDSSILEALYKLIRQNLYSPNPWADKYQWMKDYIIASLEKNMGEDEAGFCRPYLDKFGDL